MVLLNEGAVRQIQLLMSMSACENAVCVDFESVRMLHSSSVVCFNNKNSFTNKT